jgi:coenzyme PQQ synthesis protein D (PqqD)
MTVYRMRADGVACSDLGGEVVILDLTSSQYFAVRDSAAMLVGCLMGGATSDDLIEKLIESYSVTRDVATADVHNFVDALRARNLVEPVAD